MAEPMSLKADVAQLLQQIPTAANAQQMELLTRAQELVLRRDPSPPAESRLLRVAVPFLHTLLHQQNAPLVAAILQLLTDATRRNKLFFKDLFEAVGSVVLLSYSSEKNVLRALDHATTNLLDAFQHAVVAASEPNASVDELMQLWTAVSSTLDHVGELLFSAPLSFGMPTENNNRSAAVFLRAWKLVERAVLMLHEAKDATVYRDPARSNVQPDAVTVDLVPASGHQVLKREDVVVQGEALLHRLMQRLLAPDDGATPLTRRELCVAINSLSLIAAMRPQLMESVLPTLIACAAPGAPGAVDRAVRSTLKANLIKLLSMPAALPLADEVTECLIALNDGERAFRAISKSKDPKNRRKYVSAPSEASLRRARIGKRTAEQISESVEQHDHAKRARAQMTGATSGEQERITHEGLVNMPSAAVVNLVLGGFAADLPPQPPNLTLLLPPSELKVRMTSLLAKLATPSSALALENSLRRNRDPRRRRDMHLDHEQPSLVSALDDEAIEEVSNWVSKNSTTAEEPLVSVTEDNSIQVYLKPVSAVWCREMAAAALARILENEYGASIRGDDALRESLICRLASSPWFLLTDEHNTTIHPSKDDTKLPPVYQSILDFVLEDVEHRGTLATTLLHHEYVRVTSEMVHDSGESDETPPKTGDAIFRKAVEYFYSALTRALDLSSSSDKKLFGSLVASLPRVTVEVLRVVTSLFSDPHKSSGGAVLGITVLRDLIKERKSCEAPALRLLLRYTCDNDDTCRNSSIRCVANQLYVIDGLKPTIERYAIQLVTSLEQATSQDTSEDVEMSEAESENKGAEKSEEEEASADVDAPEASRSWLRERIACLKTDEQNYRQELQAYADDVELNASNLQTPLDNDVEVLRRLEFYLALCAKKPALLGHIVTAYGRSSELVRQVIFQAIEKLIKHLKQRSNGTTQVIAQMHGFEPHALGLVCHVVQILSTRSSSGKDDNDLVGQVLALWQAHMQVPDAISVLIPVLSSIPKETVLPLLPTLLSLPQNRWTVALTRVLEAMPPQVLTPIDLLIALHHVDLKQDPGVQKKVIAAINFCIEHRHAFPAEVLLHVCRVLVQGEPISKLALRTLILSVTTYPSLQQDAAHLLRGLAERRVWEMHEGGDALWKGFVKCAALIQPASFPVLLDSTRLPAEQLQAVLRDEPELRGLLREFVASAEAPSDLQVSDEARALLAEEAETEQEVAGTESAEGQEEQPMGADAQA